VDNGAGSGGAAVKLKAAFAFSAKIDEKRITHPDDISALGNFSERLAHSLGEKIPS
jgi:hypothetical protein